MCQPGDDMRHDFASRLILSEVQGKQPPATIGSRPRYIGNQLRPSRADISPVAHTRLERLAPTRLSLAGLLLIRMGFFQNRYSRIFVIVHFVVHWGSGPRRTDGSIGSFFRSPGFLGIKYLPSKDND
jgi:hypothetical protein